MTVKHEADGQKFDQAKEKWDLLPIGAARMIVRVLAYGARKYGPQNWLQVPDARRRYYAAAMRHLTAWWDGEKDDPESSLSHLAHAACSILSLLEFECRDASEKDQDSPRNNNDPPKDGKIIQFSTENSR